MSIKGHMQEITDLILNNLIVELIVPAGHCSSVYLAKWGAENSKRVYVSVQSFEETKLLQAHVTSLNNSLSIGYAAEGNSQYDYNTKIIFATNSYTKRKILGFFKAKDINNRTNGKKEIYQDMLQKKGLAFTDILIIDNCEGNSIDNIILLSLWMEVHRMKLPVPKLVLLNTNPSTLPIVPTPIRFVVPPLVDQNIKVNYNAVSDKDICDKVAEMALDIYTDPNISKNLLIFLPSQKEVDNVTKLLKKTLPQIKIIALLSGGYYDTYFDSRCNKPKIVITASKLASSISGPFDVIIDCLKHRQTCKTTTGGSRTETTLISKNTAEQRLKFLTEDGICYRMIAEEHYKFLHKNEKSQNELLFLYNVIIEYIKSGINPYQFFGGAYNNIITKNIDELKKIKVLVDANGKLSVDPAGDFLIKVHLNIKTAMFLWKWINQGHAIYPGVIIASIIEAYDTSYFYFPHKEASESNYDYVLRCTAYIREKFNKWKGDTSLHTYMNMWCNLSLDIGKGLYRLVNGDSKYNVVKWCLNNSMNYKKITELLSVITETYRVSRSEFRRTNINVEHFEASLLELALPILADIYKEDLIIGTWFGGFKHNLTGERYQFDNRRLISTIETEWNIKVIPLVTSSITTSNGTTLKTIDLAIRAPNNSPDTDTATDTDTDISYPAISENWTYTLPIMEQIYPDQPSILHKYLLSNHNTEKLDTLKKILDSLSSSDDF
jgi:hypothetical protein